MSDVVFITPNMTGTIRDEVIGTLQIATILQKQGISCKLISFHQIGDLTVFDSFLQNALEHLEKLQPKIVSFYTRSDVYHIELRMAQQIKEKWPEVYVVLGGPQSDITARETVESLSYIDFVCRGEGETTAYPLFSSLIKGCPDRTVPGLVYRTGETVMENPRPVLIEDLDSLPLIDYSLLPETAYIASSEEVFPVDVGRGCPFGCTFCSTKSFWGRKFRLKSPERICQEIQIAHDRFGYTRFNLTHDMFTFHKNMVYNTCQLLRKMDFPVHWGCSARLDCIDRKLIDEMAASGMVGIYIGIETGSPRMQKLISKHLKLEDAVKKAAYLKEKGIQTTASFIYGFPEETEEDISQTLSLIAQLLKLRSVKIQTHLCAFFAGTALLETYRQEMQPVQRYSDQTGEFAVAECQELIVQNPALFPQLQEYRTAMRERLRYFEVFVAMWKIYQPVYQYISEKYDQLHLIQMYYDFVKANETLLEEIGNTHGFAPARMIQEDQFPACFEKDENYDLIRDYCWMIAAQHSAAVQQGETVTDIICFSPSEAKKQETLSQCPRTPTIVNINKNKISEIPLPL